MGGLVRVTPSVKVASARLLSLLAMTLTLSTILADGLRGAISVVHSVRPPCLSLYSFSPQGPERNKSGCWQGVLDDNEPMPGIRRTLSLAQTY